MNPSPGKTITKNRQSQVLVPTALHAKRMRGIRTDVRFPLILLRHTEARLLPTLLLTVSKSLATSVCATLKTRSARSSQQTTATRNGILLRRRCTRFRISTDSIARPDAFAFTHPLFHIVERFAEPLEMHNLAFPEEPEHILDMRVAGCRNQMLICRPRPLLCCQVGDKIRDRIAEAGDIFRAPRHAVGVHPERAAAMLRPLTATKKPAIFYPKTTRWPTNAYTPYIKMSRFSPSHSSLSTKIWMKSRLSCMFRASKLPFK